MTRGSRADRLAEVERDIVRTETRITVQRAAVDRLRAAGEDTASAEELLALIERSLAAALDHRRMILDEPD